MVDTFMLMLVLGSTLFLQTEGCGRVPATPRPTEPPPVTTAASLPDSINSYPCSSEEITSTACLNNGTCFVYIIQGDRSPSCHCTYEYMGERCSELNPDVLIPSIEPSRVATAGIAASLAVLIIIIIVFTAVAMVHFRRNKRKREAEANKKSQQNGLVTNGNYSGPEHDVEQPHDLPYTELEEKVTLFIDEKFQQTRV